MAVEGGEDRLTRHRAMARIVEHRLQLGQCRAGLPVAVGDDGHGFLELHHLLGAGKRGVDRRGGTKSLRGVTDSWNDVDEAYRYWAEKLRYRLCQERKGMECVEPKA